VTVIAEWACVCMLGRNGVCLFLFYFYLFFLSFVFCLCFYFIFLYFFCRYLICPFFRPEVFIFIFMFLFVLIWFYVLFLWEVSDVLIYMGPHW